MSEKIDEILKKLADATSKAISGSSSPEAGNGQLGDPNCPHCRGVGYLRHDVPVNDPNFGRAFICVCRQQDVESQMRQQLYGLSQLHELEHLTFDTFKPEGRVGIGERERESIERAYNQSLLFAERKSRWLLLRGGYGIGKTHLAAAIANQCVQDGMPTLFLTVPDLLDTLRFTYSNDEVTFEERFNQVRSSPMLILDDFGTQSATEWAREKLFQIINYRHVNQLPLVVTTNLSLREIDGRIRSRLSDPDLVDDINIRAPDYRRPAEDTAQSELSSLSFHHRQTFGSFTDRKGENISSNERRTLDAAFKSANTFAQDPRGWLVFTGPYGSGKTHLAAAIANYRASDGNPVMFVVVPDLLDHLRATFGMGTNVSYDRRFEEVRAAPLLILDDLGTQAMTPWVQEKLYQLFNHRYNAELPTVITTSDDMDQIDPRLRARMQDRRSCKIQVLAVPAFRG